MRFRLLGRPSIEHESGITLLKPNRPDEFLLYMLLRPDKGACTESEIYSAMGRISWETLDGYYDDARKLLGSKRDVLEKVRGSRRFSFKRAAIRTDLDELDELVRQPGDREGSLRALRLLDAGDLLEGFSFPWLEPLGLLAKRGQLQALRRELAGKIEVSPKVLAAEWDVTGAWDTMFSYELVDPGKAHRSGTATISFDQNGVLLVKGRYRRSDRPGEPYASWRSIACHIDSTPEAIHNLVIAFESHRTNMEDIGAQAVKGLEILEITARDSTQRPVEMHGHFFRFEFPASAKPRFAPSGGESHWTRPAESSEG